MASPTCDACGRLLEQAREDMKAATPSALVAAHDALSRAIMGVSLSGQDLDALRRLEALAQLYRADGGRS